MSRLGTVRNIAIVLLIAAAVEFLPGGGRVADTFAAVLLVGFYVGLAYLFQMLYRENRISIYGLGNRNRAMLYGALAVGAVTLAAAPRMWQTGAGEIAWFALIGLVFYSLLTVYRYWRSY
jgi:hypothetical protein